MNSHHSFYIDSSDIELWKIFSLESWFDKINTTHVPFITWFSFLESDVSSCLKLRLESSNAGFICVPEFFIDCIENLFNVVNLLLFQIINLLKLFDFHRLFSDIVDFEEKIGKIFIKGINFNKLGFLNKFG